MVSMDGRGRPESFDLHVVNVDGFGLIKPTSRPGQNCCPQLLPDSSGLMFYYSPPQHLGSATPQIIKVLADGASEAGVDVGRFGGYFPVPRRSL